MSSTWHTARTSFGSVVHAMVVDDLDGDGRRLSSALLCGSAHTYRAMTLSPTMAQSALEGVTCSKCADRLAAVKARFLAR